MIMANPFKEAEKKKKVTPGGGKEHVEAPAKVEAPVIETQPIMEQPVVVEEPKVEEAPVVTEEPKVQETPKKVEKPKAAEKPAKPVNKIEALIGPAVEVKKHEKMTVAVYLSKENTDWLKQMASARGKSVSELLDQILTQLRG